MMLSTTSNALEYDNNISRSSENTVGNLQSNSTKKKDNKIEQKDNIHLIIHALVECNDFDDSSVDDLTNTQPNAIELEQRNLLSELLEYILELNETSKVERCSMDDGNAATSTVTTNLRSILGDVSSDTVSKLGNILSNLITHRINIIDLLAATMDEQANIEAMESDKKIAMSISKLALLSARIYSELIKFPGSFAIVDIGALSSLAALTKRWGIECRGREEEKAPALTKDTTKRTTKVRFSMTDNAVANRKRMKAIKSSANHPFITENEEELPSNIIEYFKNYDPKNSEAMLIYGGFQIASSLSSSVPFDFKSWSSEAREAYMDTVTTLLTITSSLLDDEEMVEYGSPFDHTYNYDSDYCTIVEQLSICIKQCCDIGSENITTTPTRKKRKRQTSVKNNHNMRCETVVYVLRGIFPVLSFHLDLPNGQKGKLQAHETNAFLLKSIVSSASKEIKLMDATVTFDDTPVKRSRVNANNQSQNLSSQRTGSQRSYSSVVHTPIEHNDSHDAIPAAVPPSLKKTNQSNLTSPMSLHATNQNQTSNDSYTKPREILSAQVGLFQKLATCKGLEKAKIRARAISIILMCVPQFPTRELSYFTRFVVQLSQSKIPRHRLFSTELIRSFLIEVYHKKNCQVMSEDCDDCEDKRTNDSILSMELLKSLHDRLLDIAPLVRVRAAQSLSEVLKEALYVAHKSNELDSSEANALISEKDTLIRSITHLSVVLTESLRRRALGDDKATVRRAAVNCLVSLITISIQFVTNDKISYLEDIDVLRQLCNDPSVVTRRAAAEGVTSLLSIKNERFLRYNNLLISVFANQVLPLILDSESTCSSKVIDLLRSNVLEPIWNERTDNLEANANHSMISWKILYSICKGYNEAGSPKVGFTALKIAFKKLLDDNKIPANHLKQLLYETKNIAILSLDASIENNPVTNTKDLKIFLSGSWCCLESITASFFHQSTCLNVRSRTKELYTLFKSSSIDGGFFLAAWEKINLALTNTDLQDYHQRALQGSARACLVMIGKLGICFSASDAQRANELFLDLLLNFKLSNNLIGLAFSALVAFTEKGIQDEVSPEYTIHEACADWMNKILCNCEEIISKFISRSHKHMGIDKDNCQVEQAVHTVGLINLIGFNVDENIILSNGNEHDQKQSQNSILGFHMKPKQSLVRLIQTLLTPSLPSMQKNASEVVYTPNKVRALAFITLGKLALRDGALAKECVNMLVRELKETTNRECCPDIQSNVLMVLGDLCVRYTNLVDKELPVLASCLQAMSRYNQNGRTVDFSLVRKHAVLMLSSLLLQDFIKWRGLLLHRFLAATVDECESVSRLAEMTLSGPLLIRNSSLFLNNFVESLFVFNACKAHPIYAAAACSGDSGAGQAVNFDGINLSGATGRGKRVRIYNMMLTYMTEECKIAVTARITKEVLGAAIETSGDLADACRNPVELASGNGSRVHPALIQRRESAVNVLTDTFAILICPLIRVGKQSDLISESESLLDQGNISASSQLAAAKNKLLLKISRKHIVETVVPILSTLKSVLESSLSPLLKDLMHFMVQIYRSFKSEVLEVLGNNPSVIAELEYDTRQIDKRLREEKRNRKREKSHV